jgi:hypothetical protein
VNVQSDVTHIPHEGVSIGVSESACSLSSALVHQTVLRIVCLFLLSVSTGIAGSARPASTSQAEQGVQIIEIAAKKYEYTPSPIRVKLGAKVQLKITALDKTHGFKTNPYPDGAGEKGDPNLVLSSNEDCFKIEKGLQS